MVRPRQRQRLTQGVLYTVLLAAVVALVVLPDWSRIQQGFADPEVARSMFPEVITTAAWNTIVYTATSFAFGLTVGLVLALMRLSSVRPYRWLATVYIEIFRGLPALVTIFLVGYGIPIIFGLTVPGGTVGKVTLGLGIVAAAYLAETIRAGIEAVPRGQREAARSLGMSQTRAMVSIVLPQAFRIIIPPLTNELVLLIKDSSLAFVLGFTIESKELFKFGRDIMSSTFNGTPLIVISLLYLAITVPMTRLVALLERRTARGR